MTWHLELMYMELLFVYSKRWKWSESEVTQSCPTLCNPMDCSLQGSSVHEIFQARLLEGVAIPFSRGSSWPRDQTWVSCTAGRLFTIWATREAIVRGRGSISHFSPMDTKLFSINLLQSLSLPQHNAGFIIYQMSMCNWVCPGLTVNSTSDFSIPVWYFDIQWGKFF